MLDSDDDLSSPGYWPSVADLFMTLFIISIAILAAVFFALLPKASSAGDDVIIIAVGKDLQHVRDPVNKLRVPLDKKVIEEKEQWLPEIPEEASPKYVIDALTETSRLAVLRMQDLEKKNEDLIKQNEILTERNKDLSKGALGYAKFKVEDILVPTNRLLVATGELSLDEHAKPSVIVEKLEGSSKVVKNQLDQYQQKHQKASDWHAWFNPMLEKAELTEVEKRKGEGLRQAVNDIKLGEQNQVIDDLITTIEGLGQQNKDLRKVVDKPPIIKLDDGGFKFPRGVATLPPRFIRKLHRQVFPAMKDVLQKYEVIDTLEIIGHTDGVPVGGPGNMGNMIPQVINNGAGVAKLKAGSNADLGLMRALAIREAWKQWVDQQFNEPKLQNIEIRCYSAAQTIPPKLGQPIIKKPLAAARRIEIRFTQLKTEARKDKQQKDAIKRHPAFRIYE